MKGLIYDVDGRKVLYIGNLLPNKKCFLFENAKLLQEIEYDDIKMMYIDDINYQCRQRKRYGRVNPYATCQKNRKK